MLTFWPRDRHDHFLQRKLLYPLANKFGRPIPGSTNRFIHTQPVLLSTVDYKSVRLMCGSSVIATEPQTPTLDLMDRDRVFVIQYSQKEDGNSAF